MIERDRNKLKNIRNSRSPSLVGELIGKSIETNKLKKLKVINDHYAFVQNFVNLNPPN